MTGIVWGPVQDVFGMYVLFGGMIVLIAAAIAIRAILRRARE